MDGGCGRARGEGDGRSGRTRLHAQEAAPDEDGAAVEQAGDGVAGQQRQVRVLLAHVAAHVLLEAPAKARRSALGLAVAVAVAQQRRALRVGGVRTPILPPRVGGEGAVVGAGGGHGGGGGGGRRGTGRQGGCVLFCWSGRSGKAGVGFSSRGGSWDALRAVRMALRDACPTPREGRSLLAQ